MADNNSQPTVWDDKIAQGMKLLLSGITDSSLKVNAKIGLMHSVIAVVESVNEALAKGGNGK